LAKKREDWSFVFVGSSFSQELHQFMAADLTYHLQRLRRFSNVYFLGRKPKEKLADFITAFDVCLIPYDVSQEFVLGSNPMKLYEYLAVGNPVVSTPIEAVKCYSPIVKIASNAHDFEKAIEASLSEGYNNKKEKEERKNIAVKNSWEEKVNEMWEQVK